MKYLFTLAITLSSVLCYGQLGGKPLSPQKVNEADILWSKRVWRRVDLQSEQNAPLRGRFADMLLNNVMQGKLKGYFPGDTSLSLALDLDSLHIDRDKFSRDVQAYRIQERWMFDRTRGKMVVEIETISPERMADGKMPEIFTVKFDDLQPLLGVPVSATDTTTLASFFDNRQFRSIIIKVANTDGSQPVKEPVKNRKKKKNRRHDVSEDVFSSEDVFIY